MCGKCTHVSDSNACSPGHSCTLQGVLRCGVGCNYLKVTGI